MITSLDNEKAKYLLKLKQKKYRDLTNEYLVEGKHLVLEANKNNTLKELFILAQEDFSLDIKTTFISKEVMKKISSLDTPSTVIGLCTKKISNEILGNKILLLDNIQDPGNLGTIIRSCKAFNIDTLVLSLDTVDLYNSKVLRGTQGIYNYLNIVKMDLKEALNYIKTKDIPIYGTNVKEGINVKSLTSKEKEKFALIMGNEGQGVKPEIRNLCKKNIYIPLNKDVESLNVSVATSILLYELNGE